MVGRETCELGRPQRRNRVERRQYLAEGPASTTPKNIEFRRRGAPFRPEDQLEDRGDGREEESRQGGGFEEKRNRVPSWLLVLDAP